MKKELKGIDENTVVHCPTEELFAQTLELSGSARFLGSAWSRYESNTVYSPAFHTVESMNKVDSDRYRVIDAEEFIRLNTESEEVFTVGEEVEVSNNKISWWKSTFIHTFSSIIPNPHKFVVENHGMVKGWKFCRKITKPEEVKTDTKDAEIQELRAENKRLKKENEKLVKKIELLKINAQNYIDGIRRNEFFRNLNG